MVIATWSCPAASASTASADSGSGDAGDSFAFPWSTSFEDGFCSYAASGGFCYEGGTSTYRIVTSPVHSGQYAAAFNVTTDSAQSGIQTRCVRQGRLPLEAYYGVWYFVPSLSTNNNAVWNLIHFAGGNSPNDTMHGLWDISIINNDTGGLRLVVYQFPMTGTAGGVPDLTGAPAIPIGKWFHIVMFLKRASDATGEVQVYQDDLSILHQTGIVTDDTAWGQWYVGNYATNLTPPQSTLYVDDVTISGAL